MNGNRRGFTLIELLVAISVLAIVAVLGWRGLDSIVRARVALNNDLEQTRGIQLAFAQLQSDCARIAAPAMIQNRLPLAAGQNRLMLLRTVFADDQPSRLQVVTYRLQDGLLTRRESIATRDLTELNALWAVAASDGDATQAVTLQSGVTAFTMRLWQDNTWQPAEVQSAPGQVNPLAPVTPTGLEVAVQLRGRDARVLKIFLLGPV